MIVEDSMRTPQTSQYRLLVKVEDTLRVLPELFKRIQMFTTEEGLAIARLMLALARHCGAKAVYGSFRTLSR